VIALLLTLLAPVTGAIALALLRPLGLAGWLNVAVSTVSFGAAVWLTWSVAATGEVSGYSFRVDAFNVYLVTLTAFVGLTTSIFSRPYMRHVCETGLTTKRGMRIYHSMYQAFMFTMCWR
jgi:hydrogenase-4 component F